MKVFIVIPAYNEEKQIGKVLNKCQQYGFSDIIVVDDGSTDGTAYEAEKYGAIVVSHCLNRGVGAATQTGLEAAKILGADVVVTIDADGQHDPQDMETLVQTMKEGAYDLVIGSRFISAKNTIPWIRRFFNKIANAITCILSGAYLTDSQSGIKAFSARALEKIQITANGYEFSSEIIREAVYAKLAIKEIPVSVQYTSYSLSKGQSFATGVTTFVKLVIRSLMR